VRAEIPVLERLTASDLFLLQWDDSGWFSDIGGLAILDGSCLLDDDGRVRIDAVQGHLEPRLHLVPRFRQLLYRPRRGWVGPCGSTLLPSILPTTSEFRRLPLPAMRPSCCMYVSSWRGDGWIQSGRCGSCGCCRACHSDGWVPSCHGQNASNGRAELAIRSWPPRWRQASPGRRPRPPRWSH